MSIRLLKNTLAAAAVSVSALTVGCARKAPVIEKAAVKVEQAARLNAGNLAKDTLDLSKSWQAVENDANEIIQQIRKWNSELTIEQNEEAVEKALKSVQSENADLLKILNEIIKKMEDF